MSLAVKHAGERLLGIWLSLIGLVVIAPVALLLDPVPEPSLLALALVPGVVGAFASVTYWIALRIGKASVVSPIVAMGGGFGAAIGVVLLGERLDPVGYAAIVVAVAGAGLASFSGVAEPTGVGWALLGAVLFGAYIVLIGEAAESVGSLWAVLALRVATLLILLPGHVLGHRSYRIAPRTGRWVVVAAVFDTVALLALAGALLRGPVAVVGVISGEFSLVTILLAAIFLNERLRWLQWIGVAVVLVSTAVLILTASAAV